MRVTDFAEVTDRDFIRSLRQSATYDPDQINALFVTPHRWTGYYRLEAKRRVIQLDQRRWDYKHQVLATSRMPPCRVMLWVKCIEVLCTGPTQGDLEVVPAAGPSLRHGMRWYTRMGRRVWFHEWWSFFFRDRRVTNARRSKSSGGRPRITRRSRSALSESANRREITSPPKAPARS